MNHHQFINIGENCMKKQIVIFIVAVISCFTSFLLASPGPVHHKDIDYLLNVPVKKGGFGGLTKDEAIKIMDFMDAPAKHIGEYHVNVSGGKTLTPTNHADLYHNPLNIRNVFHSDEAMNVARLHKIQDVAYNSSKASIDGWNTTDTMVKQAEDILAHVKKHHKFPRHLPRWVDQQGPNIVKQSAIAKVLPVAKGVTPETTIVAKALPIAKGMTSEATTVSKTLPVAKGVAPEATTGVKALEHGKTLSKSSVAGAAYGAAAVVSAVDLGLMIYNAYEIENGYEKGEIPEDVRIVAHCVNIGSKLGAIGGNFAAAALLVCSTPYGPVAWVAAAGGGIVIAWGCEKAGRYIGQLLGEAIVAWKQEEFRKRYELMKTYMDLMVDPCMTPEVYASICHDKTRVKAYTECWEAEMKTAFQETEESQTQPSFDIQKIDDSILQLDYLLKAE